MRKFALKVILFLIPILVVVVFFEYRLNQIPNSYNTKRVFLESQLDTLEVLVLGSSQSAFNINPQFFSHHGFNLGNISQSIYYDTRLTLKYLPEMPKMKCVVIPLSYFSLGYQLSDSLEAWRGYFYYQFWGIRYPTLKWYDIRLYSKMFLYTPRVSLNYARKLFRIKSSEEMSAKGWMERTVYSEINDESGKKRVQYWEALMKDTHYDENLADLTFLINTLHERGIKVVIMSTPVTTYYYQHMNPDINRRNERVIQTLCDKFGDRYYDYSHDKRFVNEDFADTDHLTAAGAEKFSRIFNSEVLDRYL